MLIIRFLGKPQLIRDNEDITLSLGGKACALLCFLFLRRGKNAPREKIAAYLWPDSTEAAARYNLRYNLWMIKKYTDEDEKRNSLLRFDREYCGINEQYNYSCDIQRIADADSSDATLEQMQTIRGLFLGELLEGCFFSGCDEFNEFILNQRMCFEQMKGRILGRIAVLYEQAGQPGKAIGAIEEIMENDPYDETLAIRLMELYAATGKRSAAIRFYHSFRGRLAANLEINPGSALYEKYTELKSAARELTPPGDDGASEEIDTFCIREIPCFWMADAVKKLLAALGPEFAGTLRPEILRSLGAIQPEALAYLDGAAGEEATMAAISQSFIALVAQAVSRARVTVVVRGSSQIDDISGGVLKYLQSSMPDGLSIRLE